VSFRKTEGVPLLFEYELLPSWAKPAHATLLGEEGLGAVVDVCSVRTWGVGCVSFHGVSRSSRPTGGRYVVKELSRIQFPQVPRRRR